MFISQIEEIIHSVISLHASTEASRFEAIGTTEVQDLSSFGILSTIRRMTTKEREAFHHIIVPDLEKLASRSKRLKEERLSTIRILAEEGFGRSWVKYQRFNFKKKCMHGKEESK